MKSDNSTRIYVFDLDDTLYKERDYVMSGYRAVARAMARRFGFNPRATLRAMLDPARGQRPFESLNSWLARGDLIGEMVEIYDNHKPDITMPVASLDALSGLKERGIRMALITDGTSKRQRAKIKALGIDSFFEPDDIIISEDIGTDKTQQATFECMMRRHPECKDWTYIGDNVAKDFYWPNRLGWTSVMLRDDGRNMYRQDIDVPAVYRPMHTIDYLRDLLI